MKHFIETHFGLVLVLACLGGLVIPGMPALPNESSIVALACLMFISCYKLEESGFSGIIWRDIALFWFLRYAMLPPLIWFVTYTLAPSFATAAFLLSVLPAAVASPAFVNIYRGAVPPAFAIVIASQLMTPLIIPLQFTLIGGEHVTPSPAHLFTTLVLCVLMPMGVYMLLRKNRPLAAHTHAQNKFYSILLIMFVIALAVAKQREVILANPGGVIAPLIVALICYGAYMLFGWYFSRGPREARITYATCSSFNNAALGVSLALMHFPPDVILFVAASEIGWALLPLMLRQFLLFFAR